MQRSTVLALIVATLCLFAVAIAAAAIAEPPIDATGIGGGTGGENGGFFVPADPVDHSIDGIFPAWMGDLVAIVTAVLLVLGLIAIIRHWRDYLPTAVAFMLIIGAVMLLLALVMQRLERGEDIGLSLRGDTSTIGFGNGAAISNGGELMIAVIIAATIASILLVGAVMMGSGRSSSDIPRENQSQAQPTNSDSAAEIGRIAGEVANRFDSESSMENDIFRAWKQMSDLVSRGAPTSKTAGEFATAAIEGGMDPGDVSALTRMFEDVRYGTMPVTPEREHTAIQIFRRIERKYGYHEE